MARLLRVKDCFKYKFPDKISIKEKGIMSPSSKVPYDEFSIALNYMKNCINDIKNLLSVHEHILENIIKSAKEKGINIKFNAYDAVKGAEIAEDIK